MSERYGHNFVELLFGIKVGAREFCKIILMAS